MEKIIKAIAEELNISIEDIKSKSRVPFIIRARQFLYKIARDNKFSLYEIADFTNKDHSTVLNGIKKFKEYYDTDKHYREQFQLIAKKTNNRTPVEIAQKMIKQMQHAGLSPEDMLRVIEMSRNKLITLNKQNNANDKNN